MTGHADLIEEAMQSLDDRRNLLRQVAGVHCGLALSASGAYEPIN